MATFWVVMGAGCSTYDTRYEFVPRPLEVEAGVVGGPAEVVTLVSIIGIRRADPQQGEPAMVEVRMLVRHRGSAAAKVDPRGLELVSADLHRFPPPRVSVEGPIQIPPGDSRSITAMFPFPDERYPGKMDLDSLTLTWEVEINGQTVPQSASVTRARDYDRHNGYFSYHFGYGHGRHRFGIGHHGHVHCY